MDLKAIATAIGGEGAGCVSVVQPYVDMKMLHRQLSASHAPGIVKVKSTHVGPRKLRLVQNVFLLHEMCKWKAATRAALVLLEMASCEGICQVV